MNFSLPSIELLEKAHTFPCPYLFKIIGKAQAGLLEQAVAIVREELHLAADPTHRIRESAGGRHLSITMEPDVHSAQQVVAIYRRLQALDGVLTLF